MPGRCFVLSCEKFRTGGLAAGFAYPFQPLAVHPQTCRVRARTLDLIRIEAKRSSGSLS